MTTDLAIGLAILLVVAGIGWWLYRRGREGQALQDTKGKLKGSEDAREREHAIEDAAKKVREAPGPVVPDLDELQRGPGSTTPPPRT